MSVELSLVNTSLELDDIVMFDRHVFPSSDYCDPSAWVFYKAFWINFIGSSVGMLALAPDMECGDALAKERLRIGSLWITSIGILPSFQRAGIGTAALEWAIEWARKNGFDRMSSNCRTSNEASARLHSGV